MTIQKSPSDMFAESTVDLELFLTEKLIQCCFVREGRVGSLVGHDVIVFVSTQGRLDIDQNAFFTRTTTVLDRRIVDQPERNVRAGGRVDDLLLYLFRHLPRSGCDRLPVHDDVRVEIDTRKA